MLYLCRLINDTTHKYVATEQFSSAVDYLGRKRKFLALTAILFLRFFLSFWQTQGKYYHIRQLRSGKSFPCPGLKGL